MKARYRLTRRGSRGDTFYSKDAKTGQRASLKTSDAEEAQRIVNAKNEAERQPMLNLGLPARQRQRHRQTDVAGLRGKRRPRTTDSRHTQPIAANLIAQRPAPTGPNQSWLTDITYLQTARRLAVSCRHP